MIHPANQELIGYDSLVYEVYFGKVEDAAKSEYQAMQPEMVQFIEYAEKIAKIDYIKLNDEDLINKALTAYKAINQQPESYGITQEEWAKMVDLVTNAKKQVSSLKLADSSQKVQSLQARINALPTQFSLSDIQLIKDLASEIANLKVDEKSVLDLTLYNQLLSSYESYKAQIENTYAPVAEGMTSTFTGGSLAQVAMIGAGLAVVLAVIKRKFFM